MADYSIAGYGLRQATGQGRMRGMYMMGFGRWALAIGGVVCSKEIEEVTWKEFDSQKKEEEAMRAAQQDQWDSEWRAQVSSYASANTA